MLSIGAKEVWFHVSVTRTAAALVQRHNGTESVNTRNISDPFEFYTESNILKRYGGETVRDYEETAALPSSTPLALL